MTITRQHPVYKDIAAKKKSIRDDKFNPEWLIPQHELPDDEVTDVLNWIKKTNHLTPEEIIITESKAVDIVNNIKSQTWTSLEVTLAFCHRASIAHQLTNCLTEIFFEEAIKRAKELDHYQLVSPGGGKLAGPFHGLPISLKDNFNVKGHGTTLGMVNFCFNPQQVEYDSTLVEMLRQLGAILYVKTNVPVAMMMPETTNHVWGSTVNPMNRLLSCGGSLGGESALIKLKGSPIGIGLDIGGSIRIPASFQNLYAIKPSFGRFPTFGTRSGLPGLESVNSVNGPISNSLDDLEFYCKTIIDAKPWLSDAKCIEIPWRQVEFGNDSIDREKVNGNSASSQASPKLNIAILMDDGFVRPTPPIRRGMEIVTEALKKDSHHLIEWDPQDHVRLSEIIGQFFVSDGGHHVLEETTVVNEPFFPYMENYGTSKDIPVSQLWQLQRERTVLIDKYLKRWNSTADITTNGKPIDAIIMPATPFAGNPLGKFPTYVGYTSPFNALDYTVGVFPVTRVDKTVDVGDEAPGNYNEIDVQVWKDYDPEESHGGAVALQLVARRFEEEKVIAMMKIISELINYTD